MKLNCGPTAAERRVTRQKRMKEDVKYWSNWHKVFIFWPKRMSERKDNSWPEYYEETRDCRWMETVERRYPRAEVRYVGSGEHEVQLGSYVQYRAFIGNS